MNDLEIKRASYARVSEIIGLQNERAMRAIPIELLTNAAERGTKLHGYCTALANGLYLPQVEPELIPYVDVWNEWRSSSQCELLKSYERLYDDKLCFTGEPDGLFRYNGKLALMDLKFTATKSITWPVQLAAYRHLCKLYGYAIEECDIIHFQKDRTKGTVKIKIYPYEDLDPYWDLFYSAIKCYKYFTQKEGLG